MHSWGLYLAQMLVMNTLVMRPELRHRYGSVYEWGYFALLLGGALALAAAGQAAVSAFAARR